MEDTPNLEIETLIAAFYAAFDNRSGRAPDGDSLRAMFADNAIITRVDALQVDSWSAEAFIEPRVEMLTNGALAEFHEWEVADRTTVLANIASRWSTYQKSGFLNGADYRGGGHKFIQLCLQGARWRISSILWEDLQM